MTICEEMQRFRDLLDEKKIAWHDASEDMVNIWICRTHGIDKAFSCVNGFGTYGGIQHIGGKNRGLLELKIGDEIKGWLTAEEALKLIEEKCN